MLSDGETIFAVLEHQGVQPGAIRERRRKWWRNCLANLPDLPRNGAPSKFTEGHRSQLKGCIDAEPLNCRALVSRLTKNEKSPGSAGETAEVWHLEESIRTLQFVSRQAHDRGEPDGRERELKPLEMGVQISRSVYTEVPTSDVV
jgi:hypothetical protein